MENIDHKDILDLFRLKFNNSSQKAFQNISSNQEYLSLEDFQNYLQKDFSIENEEQIKYIFYSFNPDVQDGQAISLENWDYNFQENPQQDENQDHDEEDNDSQSQHQYQQQDQQQNQQQGQQQKEELQQQQQDQQKEEEEEEEEKEQNKNFTQEKSQQKKEQFENGDIDKVQQQIDFISPIHQNQQEKNIQQIKQFTSPGLNNEQQQQQQSSDNINKSYNNNSNNEIQLNSSQILNTQEKKQQIKSQIHNIMSVFDQKSSPRKQRLEDFKYKELHYESKRQENQQTLQNEDLPFQTQNSSVRNTENKRSPSTSKQVYSLSREIKQCSNLDEITQKINKAKHSIEHHCEDLNSHINSALQNNFNITKHSSQNNNNNNFLNSSFRNEFSQKSPEKHYFSKNNSRTPSKYFGEQFSTPKSKMFESQFNNQQQQQSQQKTQSQQKSILKYSVNRVNVHLTSSVKKNNILDHSQSYFDQSHQRHFKNNQQFSSYYQENSTTNSNIFQQQKQQQLTSSATRQPRQNNFIVPQQKSSPQEKLEYFSLPISCDLNLQRNPTQFKNNKQNQGEDTIQENQPQNQNLSKFQQLQEKNNNSVSRSPSKQKVKIFKQYVQAVLGPSTSTNNNNLINISNENSNAVKHVQIDLNKTNEKRPYGGVESLALQKLKQQRQSRLNQNSQIQNIDYNSNTRQGGQLKGLDFKELFQDKLKSRKHSESQDNKIQDHFCQLSTTFDLLKKTTPQQQQQILQKKEIQVKPKVATISLRDDFKQQEQDLIQKLTYKPSSTISKKQVTFSSDLNRDQSRYRKLQDNINQSPSKSFIAKQFKVQTSNLESYQSGNSDYRNRGQQSFLNISKY